jgi:hypothetical protein
METPHRKIIDEAMYNMLYDEELILIPDYRLIKDSLFYTFAVAYREGRFGGFNPLPEIPMF